MASPESTNKLYEVTSDLSTLGKNHSASKKSLDGQAKIVQSTAGQVVTAYKIVGLANELEGAALAQASVPGVTADPTNLAEPDPKKLLSQPVVGASTAERKIHFGNHPPLPDKDDGLSLGGKYVDAGVGSILPWTPHPQHSYKDNSTRVPNRTGRKRPTTPKL